MICIIDYGSGNIRSVYNIFKSICDKVVVSDRLEDIENATHLVLPGVGTFGAAIDKITTMRSFEQLSKNVLNKGKYFLGICVGMQVLADEGCEYGVHKGLGWIPGKVKKMDVGDLSLPHIGWNNLKVVKQCSILKKIGDEVDFYFVHSYHFDVVYKQNLDACFDYGKEFTAVISKDNIFGVQFHPEKSQKAGVALLKNFIELR